MLETAPSGECGGRPVSCFSRHRVFAEHCSHLVLQGMEKGCCQHGHYKWGRVAKELPLFASSLEWEPLQYSM